MDYLKKLSDAELKFMNQFMAEYVSGAFKKDDNGEYSSDNFHKNPEERRECYTRNNARTRCGLTVSNATGQTYRSDDINSFIDGLTDVDCFIEGVNLISDTIHDNYRNDYEKLEEELLEEMRKDYLTCMNPITAADRKMAESNYGKKLILIFKNTQLEKKD